MEERMIELDAEPVNERDAAIWAASIVSDATVEDAVDLLLSLETVSGLSHSLAAGNALALRFALKQALRRILN